MRLYIGKNYQKRSDSVQSIFRLVGSDEDALTYALGFLLAHDSDFCAKLVRLFGIALRKPLGPNYAVHLQEVTDPKFGRRDIVIEGNGIRIVIEAKIGGAQPTDIQLFKYGREDGLWGNFKTRGVVALTKGAISETTRNKVDAKLSQKNIKFSSIQWHEILDLALRHRPSDDSQVSRYLFGEFIRYIREDYKLGYYDAEIYIQDVNYENASVFMEGWMYIGGTGSPLYFAPYFTWAGSPNKGSNHPDQQYSKGITKISRILGAEVLQPASMQEADLAARVREIVPGASEEQIEKWCRGHYLIRQRSDYAGFKNKGPLVLYLDEPITLWTNALTKQVFNAGNPPKKIPSQIPKGFSLQFDQLLRYMQNT